MLKSVWDFPLNTIDDLEILRNAVEPGKAELDHLRKMLNMNEEYSNKYFIGDPKNKSLRIANLNDEEIVEIEKEGKWVFLFRDYELKRAKSGGSDLIGKLDPIIFEPQDNGVLPSIRYLNVSFSASISKILSESEYELIRNTQRNTKKNND